MKVNSTMQRNIDYLLPRGNYQKEYDWFTGTNIIRKYKIYIFLTRDKFI